MEQNRYAVGVDVGTGTVRVVMGALPQGETDDSTQITIVGVGEAPAAGMRKGVVVDANRAASSIDRAVGEAEKVSGADINDATIGINGSSITGMSSHGMVTVDQSRPIGEPEISRVVDAATQVKLQPNRQIIDVTPHTYIVDGQDGVRDPVGMTGIRFETDVYMVTAQMPNIKNLDLAAERAMVRPQKAYVPVGMAAALMALSDKQKENGAVLIDVGHSTTNVVVYEEGDIIDIRVLPVGSNNITADLAIGLKCDLDTAEKVKTLHAVASPDLRRGNETTVAVRLSDGAPKQEFSTELIDEIVAARLDELFELVSRELKRIHRAGSLPGGAVLSGGGANLRGIDNFVRDALGMNTSIYRPKGYRGIGDKIKDPAWATALGLMRLSAESGALTEEGSSHSGGLGGLFTKLGGLFGRK